MLEFSRTFCIGHGMPWERVRCVVRAWKKGCDVSLSRSCRVRNTLKRQRWGCFLTESDALRRVMAGIRFDDRMPSWMLADVLRELGAPEAMCELVMRSDLDTLGAENGTDWATIVSQG